MNCRKYRKAKISGIGSEPGATRTGLAEMDRHHDSCSPCRRFSARYEAVAQLLAKPAAHEQDRQPGPWFAAGVIAALPERTSPLAWATVRLLPATCALALTLLGWCWLATPTPNELWTQAGEDELLTWVLSENGDDGSSGPGKD